MEDMYAFHCRGYAYEVDYQNWIKEHHFIEPEDPEPNLYILFIEQIIKRKGYIILAIVVKITAFLIGAPCIVYPWFLSVGYLAELYGNIVGFIGGFFLAPITIVVVPILMGMEYGAWFPLIMLWVGGFVAAQLNEIGNYLDNN